MVMRMVWPKPLTLALMRVVCREASISKTSLAEIPLASRQAQDRGRDLGIVQASDLIEDR